MRRVLVVQLRRNAKAARRFLTMLIKRHDEPLFVVTDMRDSFIKAFRNLAPGA